MPAAEQEDDTDQKAKADMDALSQGVLSQGEELN